jgi:hypothetical protein
MNQSIEDEFIQVSITELAALRDMFEYSEDMFEAIASPEAVIPFAIRQLAARQSSQSEPVAIYQYAFCACCNWFDADIALYEKFKDDPSYEWRIVYAAPQQAIPSGLIETLKFYANKANYKTSWDSDSNHVMEDKGEIARNALAAYESAAPTAPIESNK